MKRGEPRAKLKVLFLCTGNSARSILAEHFLRRLGPTHFEAYSAGASPKGYVRPEVLELLSRAPLSPPPGTFSLRAALPTATRGRPTLRHQSELAIERTLRVGFLTPDRDL